MTYLQLMGQLRPGEHVDFSSGGDHVDRMVHHVNIRRDGQKSYWGHGGIRAQVAEAIDPIGWAYHVLLCMRAEEAKGQREVVRGVARLVLMSIAAASWPVLRCEVVDG